MLTMRAKGPVMGREIQKHSAIWTLQQQSWASLVALAVKNLPANTGDVWDVGLIPGSRRFPGAGKGNPLQCSCLGNPMDRGAWQAMVCRSQRVGHGWSDLAQHKMWHPHSFIPPGSLFPLISISMTTLFSKALIISAAAAAKSFSRVRLCVTP